MHSENTSNQMAPKNAYVTLTAPWGSKPKQCCCSSPLLSLSAQRCSLWSPPLPGFMTPAVFLSADQATPLPAHRWGGREKTRGTFPLAGSAGFYTQVYFRVGRRQPPFPHRTFPLSPKGNKGPAPRERLQRPPGSAPTASAPLRRFGSDEGWEGPLSSRPLAQASPSRSSPAGADRHRAAGATRRLEAPIARARGGRGTAETLSGPAR